MKFSGKVLRDEIGIPTCKVMITKKDGTQVPLEIPRLSVGDLKVIKNQSLEEAAKAKESGRKVTDMWGLFLSMGEDVDESKLSKLPEEDQDRIRRQAGMKMLHEIDHSLQLKMFYLALRHLDPEITEDIVDWIISYGIEDQGEYMKALMFLPYGKQAVTEETGKVPLGTEEARPDTPSEGERLTGGGSISSSHDGSQGKR